MKLFINAVCCANLFFAGVSLAIALNQIPYFFPALGIYWQIFRIIALIGSGLFWFFASIRSQFPSIYGWVAFLTSLSLVFSIIDEVRLWL